MTTLEAQNNRELIEAALKIQRYCRSHKEYEKCIFGSNCHECDFNSYPCAWFVFEDIRDKEGEMDGTEF